MLVPCQSAANRETGKGKAEVEVFPSSTHGIGNSHQPHANWAALSCGTSAAATIGRCPRGVVLGAGGNGMLRRG
eukprot:10251601-Alexandrium_andersonii.AAC.1